MLVRNFATAALAGAVALAPTAAFATGTYPAPEDSLTCSATQVPVGTQFECVGTGPDGIEVALQATTSGEDVTFIAGTVTSPSKTIASGEAAWTVQAPSQAGEIGFNLVYFDESADAWTSYDTATVSVVAEAADDELATTGFENAGLAAGAGVLLVAGAATVFVAARRRASQNV